MPTTLTSTGITFPDGSSQGAAAAGGGFTRGGMTVAQSSGTWNKPGNLGYAWVGCLGGGGGGAGSAGRHGGGGGGGAAGAFLADDLPSSVSYTVGAGGQGGSEPNGNQNNGGASNFFNVTANGGTKGQRNSYSQTSTGNGGNGTVNGSYVTGSNGTGTGGKGGSFSNHGGRGGQSVNAFGGGGGAGRAAPPGHGIANTNGGQGGYDPTYRVLRGGTGGNGMGAGGGGYNNGSPHQQNYPYQPFPGNARANGGGGMVAIVEYNSAS